MELEKREYGKRKKRIQGREEDVKRTTIADVTTEMSAARRAAASFALTCLIMPSIILSNPKKKNVRVNTKAFSSDWRGITSSIDITLSIPALVRCTRSDPILTVSHLAQRLTAGESLLQLVIQFMDDGHLLNKLYKQWIIFVWNNFHVEVENFRQGEIQQKLHPPQDAIFNLFRFMHEGSNKLVHKFDANLKDLAIKCMFDEITSIPLVQMEQTPPNVPGDVNAEMRLAQYLVVKKLVMLMPDTAKNDAVDDINDEELVLEEDIATEETLKDTSNFTCNGASKIPPELSQLWASLELAQVGSYEEAILSWAKHLHNICALQLDRYLKIENIRQIDTFRAVDKFFINLIKPLVHLHRTSTCSNRNCSSKEVITRIDLLNKHIKDKMDKFVCREFRKRHELCKQRLGDQRCGSMGL
uniref:Uncharacterized protein n=1 Tax=Romanomermis culicivorax TaxID=13658 RepID=A0A915HP61_ROMCU